MALRHFTRASKLSRRRWVKPQACHGGLTSTRPRIERTLLRVTRLTKSGPKSRLADRRLCFGPSSVPHDDRSVQRFVHRGLPAPGTSCSVPLAAELFTLGARVRDVGRSRSLAWLQARLRADNAVFVADDGCDDNPEEAEVKVSGHEVGAVFAQVANVCRCGAHVVNVPISKPSEARNSE